VSADLQPSSRINAPGAPGEPAARGGPGDQSLPLADLHLALGAQMAPLPGGDAGQAGPRPLVPMRYGPLAAEHAALRQGCGLVDRSWIGRLEMLGADRTRFLNAYVTCDVKGLAPGQGAYGFFTSPQGRILADLVLMAREDRFWMELPAGAEEAVAGHLRKYLIADRVELHPLAEWLPLTLAGPGAAAVLAGLHPQGPEAAAFQLPDAAWSHAGASVAGIEVIVQRTGRLGVPALTLWVQAARAPALHGALLAGHGVRPVGFEALEVVRVEAGMPRFGLEFGPQNFPQETAAEEAVSYTKGCYLGQEVVARIHYRGGVQKALCGLVFEAGLPVAALAPGTPLLYEGREAGTLGTAVLSPVLEQPIGLAILHRRAAAPGSRLAVGGAGEPDGGAGATAEVRELPLAAVRR
jgi:folate-binding protein YgfZ